MARMSVEAKIPMLAIVGLAAERPAQSQSTDATHDVDVSDSLAEVVNCGFGRVSHQFRKNLSLAGQAFQSAGGFAFNTMDLTFTDLAEAHPVAMFFMEP